MHPTPEFTALQHALRGRYVLEAEIGRGGMGVVFLARDVALDRPVAIKLLPAHLASHPELRARFLLEARTAARLSHPNIVPIHAVEELGEIVCFVMAYVPGETLADRVAATGPLPADQVARLVQEVAWALAYAHDAGVVHRDIKPENILLERGTGRALLADFGIARLLGTAGDTPPGDVVGTARSMSPEQAAGELLDGRSDLYSLGVTAFFALTGRFPFEAESTAGLLAAHLAAPPPPVASLRPGIPPALARAVDRSLSKAPDDRFANAKALAESLAASGGVGHPVPPVLARLAHEGSSLLVDIVGYGTLAGIIGVAQVLTATHDFMGVGRIYALGISLVLVSLTATRGIQVSRLARDAVREGWDGEDLARAVRIEAEQEPAGKPPRVGRALLFYLAGAAGLLAFWLGPREIALQNLVGIPAILVELVSLIAPVALGRWLGGVLDTPREGRPSWFATLLTRKARWLFTLGGRLRPKPRRAEVASAPTEMLLADAGRALYEALSPGDRGVLGDVLGTIARLEREAERLRLRLRELDQAEAEVGVGDGARADLARQIGHEKANAGAQLATAMGALETIRLELLRLRAGLGAHAGLTESIEQLRQIGAGVDAVLEVNED